MYFCHTAVISQSRILDHCCPYFQVQNGILLPSLRPALPFLDLHGVRRLEFHNSVMEELRDKLMARVKELAASQDKNKIKTLSDLLSKSFPVIKVKSLQPVVMCIMQHLPKIKQEYLNVVIDDPELYKLQQLRLNSRFGKTIKLCSEMKFPHC